MRFDHQHRVAALALLLVCSLSGCAGTAVPRIFNPGSASQQLAQAREFDPYPDPTLGPDITGARPRGFLNPRPDPDASKLQKHGPWPSQYPPAAAAYAPAPPYVGGTVVSPAGMSSPVVSSTAPPIGYPTASPSVVYSAAPPASYFGPQQSGAVAAPAVSAAPVAYGKALNSP